MQDQRRKGPRSIGLVHGHLGSGEERQTRRLGRKLKILREASPGQEWVNRLREGVCREQELDGQEPERPQHAVSSPGDVSLTFDMGGGPTGAKRRTNRREAADQPARSGGWDVRSMEGLGV